MLRFDLQSHSLHSDGALPPAEVVARAADAGVELLALTDHDSVDGVAEAIAAGDRLGVRVIPAAELSSVHGGLEDLHVLGYGVDIADETWLERLRGARAERVQRAERMGELLRELGFSLDGAPLEQRRAAGASIGRPHLAAAVVSHPDNRERLQRESVADVSPFIATYLVPGAPAYLPRTHPTVAEAIGWIGEAGGVAVWAHPFWDVEAPDEVLAAIDEFAALGLGGVEAFYPTHTAEQTRLVAARCAELGLLTTGSSDFHGPDHRLFSRFLAHDLHGCEPELGELVQVPDRPGH
ncbi:MAG: PHP domain-containing protein [Solirubrobacteraceae bacterium]